MPAAGRKRNARNGSEKSPSLLFFSLFLLFALFLLLTTSSSLILLLFSGSWSRGGLLLGLFILGGLDGPSAGSVRFRDHDLANASDRDKFRVYKIIEEVRPILEQRNVLQQHAEAALREAEALESQRQQQTLIQRVQQRQEAANSVADKLKNKLTFLSGMEGVDLSAIAKEAAELEPSTLDPVTGTYQARAAKLLPKMAAQYMSLQKEIDTLTERLAEYDRATPRAGGGSLAAGGAPTTADGKSFLDAVTAAFGR